MPKSRRTSGTLSILRGRPNVWIRSARSPIHGQGVYARCTIPDGTRIVEYRGERIGKAEAERREVKRLARLARGGDGCVYIFHLNRRHDLDGRTRGNLARFINHSCAPNCRAETIKGKIWIIARREIPAGSELSFDYGYGFKEWRQHPCRCEARGCVGYIVNAPQRWLVRRALRQEARLSRENSIRRPVGPTEHTEPTEIERRTNFSSGNASLTGHARDGRQGEGGVGRGPQDGAAPGDFARSGRGKKKREPTIGSRCAPVVQ